MTEDLFFLPYKEYDILYAPKLGKVAKVTREAKKAIIEHIKPRGRKDAFGEGLIKFLGGNGFFDDLKPREAVDKYTPTTAILIPSYDCNLKCKYCFSNAGEEKTKLSFGIAKAAIDLIAQHTEKGGKMRIAFTGGGEPFTNWEVMKKTLEYAEKKYPKHDIAATVVSNGIISKQQAKWAARKLDGIGISFDGPGDIQNLHRPLASGGPSFDHVYQTIRLLTGRKGTNVDLRVTVSKYSVSRMAEIVEYIDDNFKNVRSIQFEPVFRVGRCKISGWRNPSTREFIKNYKKAHIKSKERGIRIKYSGADLNKISTRFCGATCFNIVVTPEGRVSSCLEVTSPKDKRFKFFSIGRFDDCKERIILDEKRMTKLFARTVDSVKKCRECFAKYVCGGECAAKIAETNMDLNNVDEYFRCDINRELTKYYLEEIVGESAQSRRE
jgi:uncharacterized protein